MTGVAVLLAVCLSWMCAFMDDWTLLFTCIAIVRLVPAVIARGLAQPQQRPHNRCSQMLWDIIAVLTPCGPLRYAMAVTKVRTGHAAGKAASLHCRASPASTAS